MKKTIVRRIYFVIISMILLTTTGAYAMNLNLARPWGDGYSSSQSRTVMHLGRLHLSRALWPQLAMELSSKLRGEQILDIPRVKVKKQVRTIANQAIENFHLRTELSNKKLERKTEQKVTCLSQSLPITSCVILNTS